MSVVIEIIAAEDLSVNSPEADIPTLQIQQVGPTTVEVIENSLIGQYVPDPAGESDGRILTTSSGTLVYANNSGGGGGTDDQTAAEVAFTPAGGLASTDVQNALEELDTEKAASSHAHDGTYYTETETDALLAGKEDSHGHPFDASGTAAAAVATHEGLADPHDQYLTEAEADALYEVTHNHPYSSDTHDHNADYATIAHGHDDDYYTETEVDTLLSGKEDSHGHPYAATAHNHTESEITDLGEYPDATGQLVGKVAQTDGADGWTFIDTPSGGGGGTDDQTAAEVPSTPSGNLAASNVQAALNELQSDVDTRATDASLSAHTGDTTSVHGISDTSALETQSGAQSKADAAQSAAEGTAAGALSAHESDTTAVHGIADTSALITTSDAASTIAAGVVELATDTEATTGTDTSRAVTPAGVAAALAANTSDDQVAAEVPFTPAGGIAATDVQAALVELDAEKAAAHAHPYAATAHDHDAEYYTEAEADALLAGKADTHTHPYEASGAVSTHEGAANPHPVYLTQAEGDALYEGTHAHPYAGTAHNHDAAYEALGHAHGDIYYTETETDALLAGKADTHAHPYAADSHGHTAADVPFTPAGEIAATDVQAAIAELDAEKSGTGHSHSYEASGAVSTHEGAGDPHPQYLTAAEGDAAYEALGHAHGGIYYTETEVDALLAGKEDSHGHPYAATSHTHNEADITDLGSYPDSTGELAGKVAETDGAGGWTFIDTPSGGAGTDDQTAAEVAFTPAGNVAATDVQAAIAELDTEKSATGHSHDADYYTEAETDALLANKSDTAHGHTVNPLAQVGNLVTVIYDATNSRFEFADGTVPNFTGRVASIMWQATSGNIPAQGAGDADFKVGDIASIRDTEHAS